MMFFLFNFNSPCESKRPGTRNIYSEFYKLVGTTYVTDVAFAYPTDKKDTDKKTITGDADIVLSYFAPKQSDPFFINLVFTEIYLFLTFSFSC